MNAKSANGVDAGNMPANKAPTTDCIVVIPTYNEEENIRQIISDILHHPRFRILVVDDNSPDGTGDIVAQLAKHNPRVQLLSRPGKLGLGTAYTEGFRHALNAGALFIFEMDADFSHHPNYLPTLLHATEKHYDLTLGSRYVKGGGTIDWGLLRRFISRGGNLYASTILGIPIADSTGGFRCYRRKILENLQLDRVQSNGYSFQIEMVYRTLQAGFQVGEIPIIFPDRRVGKSKMSRRIVLEALLTVWKLRFGFI